MRFLVGSLLFGGGFWLFIASTKHGDPLPSAWITVGGLLAMVIGAFVAEGFRQRWAVFLLLCIAIGAAVGIAVGWLTTFRDAEKGEVTAAGMSVALYSGIAAAIISGLSGLLILRKAPRRKPMSPED